MRIKGRQGPNKTWLQAVQIYAAFLVVDRSRVLNERVHYILLTGIEMALLQCLTEHGLTFTIILDWFGGGWSISDARI